MATHPVVVDHVVVQQREVVHQLPAVAVVENGTDRDLENYVFAVSARPVGTFAVRAASCLVFRIEAKMY